MKNPFEEQLNSPENIPAVEQSEADLEMDRQEKAREIARGGNFEDILAKLEEAGLLDEQVNNLQERFCNQLEAATFLSHEDWKALTVLELYDTGTFEHSLDTYLIARKKVEQPIKFEGHTIVLAEKIEQEGLFQLEQFYRACLLHDIGKIEIPHFIITSKINHIEWAEMLVTIDERNGNDALLKKSLSESGITLPEEISQMEQNTFEEKENRKMMLAKFLSDNNVRCEKYVPVSEALDNPLLGEKAFSPKNMGELDARGLPNITSNSPLFDIAKLHEKKSSGILRESMHLEKEATLAGAHHDYDRLYAQLFEENPYAVSSFQISNKLAEFLRLTDMYQAIKSKRTYKNSESRLEALLDLTKSVDGKKIHYLVAYLWISSEMETLKDTVPSEHEHFETLREKLAEFREKMGDITKIFP